MLRRLLIILLATVARNRRVSATSQCIEHATRLGERA